MSLYLLINLLSISVPFLVSFDKQIQLMKDWKSIIVSLFLAAIPFIVWDIYFTEQGFSGFNPTYLLGVYFFNLPIEEILFFVCIPFSCLFTQISILKLRAFKLSESITTTIGILIIIICLFFLIFNIKQAYTSWVMLSVILTHGFAIRYYKELLSHFYITFLFMLIPFIMVNGVLTGFGIPEEVVWYSNPQNSGIRFFTIPMEYFFYAYSLTLLNLMLFKFFSKNQCMEYPLKS